MGCDYCKNKKARYRIHLHRCLLKSSRRLLRKYWPVSKDHFQTKNKLVCSSPNKQKFCLYKIGIAIKFKLIGNNELVRETFHFNIFIDYAFFIWIGWLNLYRKIFIRRRSWIRASSEEPPPVLHALLYNNKGNWYKLLLFKPIISYIIY